MRSKYCYIALLALFLSPSTIAIHQPLKKVQARGKNVPYYTCGDQQKSCELIDEPNVCCPVSMACYASQLTTSKVICCEFNKQSIDCTASLKAPPKCLDGTIECSAVTGGACCPIGTTCSPNGCIEIKRPSIVGSSTPTAVGSTVVTVTESPASTATFPKEGQIGQFAGAAVRFQMKTCCVPWIVVFGLTLVACLMNWL